MAYLRHDRIRRLLVASLGLGAFGAVCWFDLGMQRGLLLSSDIKSKCWPWAPSYSSPALQAPLLSDPVWQFVPWLEFARRELLSGRLPLWNPHQDGGVPLLGNAQSALVSPLIVPTLLLGVAGGWDITLLLKLLVATLGMFLWLRDIGRSRMAAALGGFMFGLSGPYIAWLEHPHTLVAAPLPFLLLFGGRLVRRSRPADFVGMVAATAAVLLGGHPETAVMAGAVAAVLILAGGRTARDASWLSVAGGLGLLVAAIAIIPSLEYFALSAARFGEDRFPFTLPVGALVRFVAPHAAIGHPIEAASTVSVVGIALAGIGALRRGRGRPEVVSSALAAALLALAYANPLSNAVAHATLVYCSRGLLLLPIPLGLLASGGLDWLRAKLERANGRRVSLAAATVVTAVACAELLVAARGVHAVTPSADLDRSTPVLERLARDPEPFRILPLHTFLPPNSATSAALDDIRGYDAFAPREWRVERAAIGRFTRTSYVSDVLEPWDIAPGGRALDEWNVKYLLVHPQLPYNAERLNREFGLDLEEVYLGFDGRLLRNRRALPRARLVGLGTTRVLQHTPMRWDLAVEAPAPVTLVLANPMFPGWIASVDGQRTVIGSPVGRPIEVAVPRGSHTVVLQYRPLSVRIGVVLCAVGIVGTGVLAGRCGKRHRGGERRLSGDQRDQSPQV